MTFSSAYFTFGAIQDAFLDMFCRWVHHIMTAAKTAKPENQVMP